QASARGRRAVRRLRGRTIKGERLGQPPETLHDAALEHSEIGVARRRLQGLEFTQQALRRTEVAHLDRGLQGLLKCLALQLYRQCRGRGLDRTEAFARLGPLALLRERERAPKRRI